MRASARATARVCSAGRRAASARSAADAGAIDDGARARRRQRACHAPEPRRQDAAGALPDREEGRRGRHVVRLPRERHRDARALRDQGALGRAVAGRERDGAPAPRGERSACGSRIRTSATSSGSARRRMVWCTSSCRSSKARFSSDRTNRRGVICRSPRSARLVRDMAAGLAGRARAQDRASRSQARERHGVRAARRQRVRRRDGFRSRQGAQGGRRAAEADGDRHHPRHAGVHEPGAAARQAARRANGHLFARRS